jgi:hypothetical protein
MNRRSKMRGSRQPAFWHKLLLIPLAIILIVSLACEVPGVQLPQVKVPEVQLPGQQSNQGVVPDSGRAAPTSVNQPPAALVPTATQLVQASQPPVDLPPVLAESQPLNGSQIPAKSSLTFYFS